MKSGLRFAVVLVTYNRLECLKIALQKYDQQTKKPSYILVVNNASTDGTAEYLNQWREAPTEDYQKIVVHCTENTGGAGGFYRGLEMGAELNCDFLFLADDDAYAEPDMLEKLEEGYRACPDEHISALCTAVLNEGEVELTHRRLLSKGLLDIRLIPTTLSDYQKKWFKVDILTFVGAVIKKSSVKQVGLPRKDYFIYHDDTEYSIRLRKAGNIICVGNSVMHHDVGHKHVELAPWKYYYDERNYIDTIRRHYGRRYALTKLVIRYVRACSVFSKLLHGASAERRQTCRAGLRDGFKGRLGKNERYAPGK